MSDKDKALIAVIAERFPKMSDFEKGYVLGIAESRANDRDDTAQAEQCKDAQGQPD